MNKKQETTKNKMDQKHTRQMEKKQFTNVTKRKWQTKNK